MNKLPYQMEQKDITPFFQAILDGKIEEVRKQIYNGIDINSVDSKGRNAIFYAVVGGNLNVLILLIEKGLSPKFIDPVTGGSMLHVASSERHMHILKYLVVDCNLDVNILDKDNHTVLYDCMVFTQMETAVFLIENGAKNIGNVHYIEALVRYIKKYLKERYKELLDKYENFEKRLEYLQKFINENSKTLEKCSQKINSNVRRILLKYGITNNSELSFYKDNLSLEQKKEILSLYLENPKNKKIRTIIWQCYLENWVTRFFTTFPDKFMYPAYLLPFTGEEAKRDFGIKDDDVEGINVADFIKTIDTFLPRFGRDYYDANRYWISIPHSEKEAYFNDVQVETSKNHTKNMDVFQKYDLMRKAWSRVYLEEKWLHYNKMCFSGKITTAI